MKMMNLRDCLLFNGWFEVILSHFVWAGCMVFIPIYGIFMDSIDYSDRSQIIYELIYCDFHLQYVERER